MRHKAEWYERFNEARSEDVAWMAATGECLSGAARRLGIMPNSLDSWCRANGMHTELATLLSREPGDPNQLERTRKAAAARWAS